MLEITLDSGATVSYIKLSKAVSLGLTILPNHQLALLADEKTRMASIGEVDFQVFLNSICMRVRALVMKNLQVECFGGTTFHVDNDIQTRIKNGTVSIHGQFTVKQSNPFSALEAYPLKDNSDQTLNVMNATCETVPPQPVDYNPDHMFPQMHTIALPHGSIVYPGDYLQIPLLSAAVSMNYISIFPSFLSAYDDDQWNPQICEVFNGNALFKNNSRSPLIAKKHNQFKSNPVSICNLHSVTIARPDKIPRKRPFKMKLTTQDLPEKNIYELLKTISINKNLMSDAQVSRINDINFRHHKVFDGDLSYGYNHKSGRFFADFIFSSKPPPTRVFTPQFNKKCADLLQAKCDDLELKGVIVDPKLYDIPVLHVSPSWVQQKGRAKHKPLQDCALDELRFITAFNALNDAIRPKPTTSCSATLIFLFLARWQFHIYADLNNSYFQLHVKKNLWGYLGIMTPYKGIRVMTRTGQGLLGSDVELEQLISRVLGEDIAQGHCIAIRDDIIIGGNTIDDTLSNYESVVKKLDDNNLKLSPNKVRVFPKDTEIYGYRVVDGCILPSNHTVTSLGETKIENLVTNKQVNSWKGLYKTLIGHLPALSLVMSPFDSATVGKNSNEKFAWTPSLTAAFNAAMTHLKEINRTYLPKPKEQLILLPDAMSTSPCVGWVLYVTRNEKLLPVSYCTAKLKEYMTRWYPCEKEAIGAVLAIEQCAHWINESELPTLVGPDSLAVVKAADLIRRGSHSSNPRLQSLLASVNRRNIRFFHNSAKAGKHIVPDYLSRMVDSTCKSEDCAIERFLSDIPHKIEAMSLNANCETSLLSLTFEKAAPAVVAATSTELAEQLINRSGSIPLGSRQTWMSIQKSDEHCLAVFQLKTIGELPRKKTSNPIINKIHKESIIHQGLLVVKQFDNRKMKETLRVVVPPTYLDSILTILHLRLNHPKRSQLKVVFQRYFFSPKTDAALANLYSSCHTCVSLAKIPQQMEIFNPMPIPRSPWHGHEFRHSQKIRSIHSSHNRRVFKLRDSMYSNI